MIRRLVILCLSLTLAACGTSTPTGGGGTPRAPSPVTPTDPTPSSSIDISEIIDRILADQDEVAEIAVTEAQPALFVSNLLPGQPDPDVVKTYVDATVAHLDLVWTNWFVSNNLAEPWVSYNLIMPGAPQTSACPLAGQTTFASDFGNAFYCNRDPIASKPGLFGAVYLPLDTMGKMWTGEVLRRQVSDMSKVGDFAAAMLTAHEFGHHIQDELGLQVGIKAPTNPNVELIADCFAGIWTYSVFLDGYLEAGDLDEALEGLGAIADYNPTDRSHGTAAERKNAYLIGYNGTIENPIPGLPANCIAVYWPEWK